MSATPRKSRRKPRQPVLRQPVPIGEAGGKFSLSEHAYTQIREHILRGVLPLGAPLSRRKLASELGMSLLPVSEALKRLENEGLVESRPRVTTRVCRPTPDDIREHYQVREALESQAARLFAEKASAREREELHAMATEVDELFLRCSGGEADAAFLYHLRNRHLQLHLRIAECTGCRALREVMEKNHVLVFTWLFDIAAKRPPLPADHHRKLIEAISAGNPIDADRAMRLHVREGLESILRALGARAEDQGPIMRRVR